LSILLVDIGNTRAKWALLKGGRVGRQHAVAHSGMSGRRIAQSILGKRSKSNGGVERLIAVSVAGARIDTDFASEIRRRLGVRPEFFASTRRAGGVTTLYSEPWRLGADRFAAVIGAFHLSKGRPVCVVSVGTAMTVDMVDGRGRHRGGAIIPAPSLMVASLLRETHGIRRRAQGGKGGTDFFARNTRSAITQGARYAAAAVADRAISEAKRVLKRSPVVLLTGGAAPDIRSLLSSEHRHVPDLVLQGLAVIAAERSSSS
jgi:type III pantothenate kinase